MNGIPRPDEARLQIWTIYNRPSDYPSNYVARLSLVGGKTGVPEVTEHLLVSTDLGALRDQMMSLGLTCIPRYPEDQPHIIEVWL